MAKNWCQLKSQVYYEEGKKEWTAVLTDFYADFSKDLEKAQIAGKLAVQMRRDREKVRDAFEETSRRICGERIPIMSYLPEKKRRKLLYS